jgi:hypothetical protein
VFDECGGLPEHLGVILVVQSERDFGPVREARKLDLKIEACPKENLRAVDGIDDLRAAGEAGNGNGKANGGSETSMHFAIHSFGKRPTYSRKMTVMLQLSRCRQTIGYHRAITANTVLPWRKPRTRAAPPSALFARGPLRVGKGGRQQTLF